MSCKLQNINLPWQRLLNKPAINFSCHDVFSWHSDNNTLCLSTDCLPTHCSKTSCQIWQAANASRGGTFIKWCNMGLQLNCLQWKRGKCVHTPFILCFGVRKAGELLCDMLLCEGTQGWSGINTHYAIVIEINTGFIFSQAAHWVFDLSWMLVATNCWSLYTTALCKCWI